MKYLIASDLHGSKHFTEKLLKLYESIGADMLVLTGDLYYHGPRNPLTEIYDPRSVADMLNGMKDKLLVVKGNCDSEVDEMISEFAFHNYAEITVGTKRVGLTHGHVYNIDRVPPGCDVLIYGHVHTGFITKAYGMTIANCGSVSLPKNGTPNSALILDGEELSLVTLDGEVIQKTQI